VVFLAVAAVVSGFLVWWATAPWGPGLSPDAIAYAAIAESVRDSGEIGYWLEPAASSWPPLFPVLLASASVLLDVSVVDAGRILNVGCQMLTVVAVGVLGRRLLADRWLVVIAVVTASVAQPLVYVAVKVWSEPLFNVFVLFAALALSGVPGRRATIRLVGASALVIGAFMTRYAGLALVPAGVVVLAMWPRDTPIRERVSRVVWFAVPATIAAMGLLAWNRWRSGQPFGPRWRPDEPVWNHVADALDAVGRWFLPMESARTVAILFGVGVLAAAGLAVARAVRVGTMDASPDHRSEVGVTVVLATIVAAYFAYMVWARTTSGFDPLNSRLMLPIFLPAVLLVLSLVDRLVAAQNAGPARVAVFALAGVLVTPTVLNGLDELRTSREIGNEYTNAAVQEFVASPVLQQVPDDCALLTNDPWLMWLTGREAQLTPQQNREVAIPRSMELEELAPLVGERPTCLVWMATGSTIFFTPDALDEVVDLEEVVTDGFTTIYRVSLGS